MKAASMITTGLLHIYSCTRATFIAPHHSAHQLYELCALKYPTPKESLARIHEAMGRQWSGVHSKSRLRLPLGHRVTVQRNAYYARMRNMRSIRGKGK